MRFLLLLFLFIPLLVLSQNNIQEILDREYEKGHFNGTLLYADGKEFITVHKGFSNMQFDVAINSKTRFPIASLTKLFTTTAIIQLQEKGLINIKDKIGGLIKGLPEDCKHITIQDLITHYSGLKNEPIKAVVNKYAIDDYIKDFVEKSAQDTLQFNYNNVDFVLLSKIIENVTDKSFSTSISELIISPLHMENTGFINENNIIKNLAYGYHNYSFGEGKKNDALYNDRRYISNYYGAGGIYSTTEDLYKLLIALKNNTLISEKAKLQFVVKPQTNDYVDWLSGKPTFGFYYDDTKKETVLRRSGSIDGFNCEIIVNKNFDKVLIVLCNTDTSNLRELTNKIYFKE